MELTCFRCETPLPDTIPNAVFCVECEKAYKIRTQPQSMKFVRRMDLIYVYNAAKVLTHIIRKINGLWELDRHGLWDSKSNEPKELLDYIIKLNKKLYDL